MESSLPTGPLFVSNSISSRIIVETGKISLKSILDELKIKKTILAIITAEKSRKHLRQSTPKFIQAYVVPISQIMYNKIFMRKLISMFPKDYKTESITKLEIKNPQQILELQSKF